MVQRQAEAGGHGEMRRGCKVRERPLGCEERGNPLVARRGKNLRLRGEGKLPALHISSPGNAVVGGASASGCGGGGCTVALVADVGIRKENVALLLLVMAAEKEGGEGW